MAKDSVSKMSGEAFREIGILIFVFSLLDKLVSGTITTRWTATAIGLSVLFFGAGVFLERIRTDG
jgi:hypothetical protein